MSDQSSNNPFQIIHSQKNKQATQQTSAQSQQHPIALQAEDYLSAFAVELSAHLVKVGRWQEKQWHLSSITPAETTTDHPVYLELYEDERASYRLNLDMPEPMLYLLCDELDDGTWVPSYVTACQNVAASALENDSPLINFPMPDAIACWIEHYITLLGEVEISAHRRKHVNQDKRDLPDHTALPDPTKIEQGGSFAEFMGEKVDPLIKKQALRALWKQPQFQVLDGLVEYGEDFTKQTLLTAEESSALFEPLHQQMTQIQDQLTEIAKQKLSNSAQALEQKELTDSETTETDLSTATDHLSHSASNQSSCTAPNSPQPDEQVKDKQSTKRSAS